MGKKEIKKILKEAGLKATAQRIMVYEALEKLGHSEAGKIFSTVRRKIPSISIATVYSVLNTLSKANIISKIILRDDKQYFDITPTPHSHFLCNICSKIWDIQAKMPQCPKQVFAIASVVEKANITFYGICKDCWNEQKKEVENGN